jgi:hypothetical protein
MPALVREGGKSRRGHAFACPRLLAAIRLASVVGARLLVTFMQECLHLAPSASAGTEAKRMLGAPTLIDLALMGGVWLIGIVCDRIAEGDTHTAPTTSAARAASNSGGLR